MKSAQKITALRILNHQGPLRVKWKSFTQYAERLYALNFIGFSIVEELEVFTAA